jgi:hypothetical protein
MAQAPKKTHSRSASVKGKIPYKIYVKAISARDVFPQDPDGFSDPYVILELEGSKQKVQTNFIENNLNPVWNEELDPLDGGAVGSDLLKITLMDHDKPTKRGKKNDDDPIGLAELKVRELQLGVPFQLEVPTTRCNKKGKIEKGAGPGSGGIVTFEFSIQLGDNGRTANAPWTWPFYNAEIEFTSASGIPDVDGAAPDPYVVVKLGGSFNDQKTKTKNASGTANPEWNETKKFLLGDIERESFDISIWSKGNDKDKVAKTTLYLSALTIGATQNIDITLEPGSDKFTAKPTLKVKVTIQAQNPGAFAGLLSDQGKVKTRAVEVEITEFECHFQWGSYSSKYSTSFSGYSNERGSIKSLSELEEGEEVHHHHVEPSDSSSSSGKKKVKVVQREEPPPPAPAPQEPAPAEPAPKAKKLTGRPFLKGTVISASALIRADSDGTDSYVVVKESGKDYKKLKLKEPKSALIHDTEYPRWNFAFDLGEVTKGGSVEFTVFQSHKLLGDAPIGFAIKEFSTIEVENPGQVVEIPLQKPKKFKKVGKIADFPNWGSLQVTFDYHFE